MQPIALDLLYTGLMVCLKYIYAYGDLSSSVCFLFDSNHLVRTHYIDVFCRLYSAFDRIIDTQGPAGVYKV